MKKSNVNGNIINKRGKPFLKPFKQKSKKRALNKSTYNVQCTMNGNNFSVLK